MSAYKPKTFTSEFEKITGLALIQYNKEKNKYRIIFKDKELAEKPVILKAEDCPDNARDGKYIVSITKDKTKLLALHPNNGMFEVKTAKFSSQKDKPPVPKLNQQWNYFYFTVVLEIVSGREKGLNIPYTLHYNFGEAQNEKGDSVVAYTKGGANAKHTPLLDEYLTIAGAWDAGEMKYTDNILPDLEKRILRANKTFKVVLKDGWVTTVYANESMPEEDVSGELADWDDCLDDSRARDEPE